MAKETTMLRNGNGWARLLLSAAVSAVFGAGSGYGAAVSRFVSHTELDGKVEAAIDNLRRERREVVASQLGEMQARITEAVTARTLDRDTLNTWRGEQAASFIALRLDIKAIEKQQGETNALLRLTAGDKP
jgi:hypothetical protein